LTSEKDGVVGVT